MPARTRPRYTHPSLAWEHLCPCGKLHSAEGRLTCSQGRGARKVGVRLCGACQGCGKVVWRRDADKIVGRDNRSVFVCPTCEPWGARGVVPVIPEPVTDGPAEPEPGLGNEPGGRHG